MQWFQAWHAPIVIVVLFLAIQFWLRLLAWKNWAAAYKAWVAKYCECKAPGDPPPVEPHWP